MQDKIILHIDMNSYYASLEQQAYPVLRGKPIGIAGKGKGERTVVAGVSKEAKKLGVRGAISTWEAKQICPQIIIIPANYDRYTFTSQRIFRLLERFSPKVEVFSIDEAFLELPNHNNWAMATSTAKSIKKAIHKEIGEWLTCSIGISYGRTLAKLGSDLEKPDGLVVIRPENFSRLTQQVPIEQICGIGRRLGRRLNQLGVFTISDLAVIPKAVLVNVLGEFTGSWLSDIGQGIDNGMIHSFHDLPQEKSVGHAYTVPRDLTSTQDTKRVLFLLCERVAARLRRKELVGRTVSLYLRFYDRSSIGEHHSTKNYSNDGLTIFRLAEQILVNLNLDKPIRLVSITVSQLVTTSQLTMPIFEHDQRYLGLILALDKVNNRYGEFTVHRGAIASVRKRIFKLPDGRNFRQFTPEDSQQSGHFNSLRTPNSSPFMKRLEQ